MFNGSIYGILMLHTVFEGDVCSNQQTDRSQAVCDDVSISSFLKVTSRAVRNMA